MRPESDTLVVRADETVGCDQDENATTQWFSAIGLTVRSRCHLALALLPASINDCVAIVDGSIRPASLASGITGIPEVARVARLPNVARTARGQERGLRLFCSAEFS